MYVVFQLLTVSAGKVDIGLKFPLLNELDNYQLGVGHFLFYF
jgi:hypothetical protein